MHELSIAIAMIEEAGEALSRMSAPAERVLALHVRVGALSGLVRTALLAAFEMAREATPLEGCKLIIHEVPISCRCNACNAEQPVRGAQHMVCAVCGQAAVDVIKGRELEVFAMELINEPCQSSHSAG